MIYTFQEIKNQSWKWIAAILLLAFMITTSFRGGDFDLFMMSGERFWNGQNIYKPGYYESHSVYYFYGYPFSMVLSFFKFFPLPFVRLLWLCLNIYFMVQSWRMVVATLSLQKLTKSQQNIFYFACGAFMIHFINLNISAGQMTPLLLFISLKSIELAEKKNDWVGSSLLAFGIVIKTLPLAIVAYLLYRGYFRFVCLTIFFFVLYFNIPCWVHGYPYCVTQLTDWLDLAGLNNPKAIRREYWAPMHSFYSLFLVYCTTYGEAGIEFSRQIFSIGLKDLNRIILIVSLITSGFTLYFIRRMPFTQPQSPLHRLREISYMLVIIPLVFPMQQKYSFLFIFPAIAYILHAIISRSLTEGSTSRKTVITLLIMSFLLFISTIDLIFGQYVKDISQYLKFSTFADLLLIPCLIICNPNNASLPIENLETQPS